jgi:hypothetical protein
MTNNLRFYHTVLRQLRQWLPAERVTRQRNMALLVTGLFFGMAIHLSQIAAEWPLPDKNPSLTNRLRRFLDNERVEVTDWYRPIAEQLLSVFAGREIRLVIDCTKVGFDHRLLLIGLAYRKRTLPLVWKVVRGRKGHVTNREQIALFRLLLPLIPRRSQVWVVGDAGFQGVPLLRQLQRWGWHFVIRQQRRILVYRAGQGWCKLNALPLDKGATRVIGWVRLTRRYNAGWLWLVLHWAADEDEPWYLVADQPGHRRLIQHYQRRMWVEEMFGDLKGHGFDLQATHLDDAARIARLVLAVCITFVWFITLGGWLVKRGLRHWVDRKDRRDKSYFRLGWDWLKRCNRLNLPFRLQFKPYL